MRTATLIARMTTLMLKIQSFGYLSRKRRLFHHQYRSYWVELGQWATISSNLPSLNGTQKPVLPFSMALISIFPPLKSMLTSWTLITSSLVCSLQHLHYQQPNMFSSSTTNANILDVLLHLSERKHTAGHHHGHHHITFQHLNHIHPGLSKMQNPFHTDHSVTVRNTIKQWVFAKSLLTIG